MLIPFCRAEPSQGAVTCAKVFSTVGKVRCHFKSNNTKTATNTTTRSNKEEVRGKSYTTSARLPVPVNRATVLSNTRTTVRTVLTSKGSSKLLFNTPIEKRKDVIGFSTKKVYRTAVHFQTKDSIMSDCSFPDDEGPVKIHVPVNTEEVHEKVDDNEPEDDNDTSQPPPPQQQQQQLPPLQPEPPTVTFIAKDQTKDDKITTTASTTASSTTTNSDNDNNKPSRSLSTTATTTTTTIVVLSNNNNNSNEEQHQKVVTEGQLKWAQFHYRRRAQEVRQGLETLWQTPASVTEVEGALSDDGNTTVEEDDDDDSAVVEEGETKEQQEQLRIVLKRRKEASSHSSSTTVNNNTKPTISRGRRALLRVSKRAFAKRREEIQKFGFRCSGDIIDDEEDEDSYDGAGSELAAQYADTTAWKKAKRNRRKSRRRRRRTNHHNNNKKLGRTTSDEDRLARFEDAFRAMMMSLAASQQPQHPEIAAPTKVWSRPEDAQPFVSIDGRQYQDLKWGVSAMHEKSHHPNGLSVDYATNHNNPMDRRASWLVHIPSKSQPAYHQECYNFMASRFPTNAAGEFLVPENKLSSSEGEKLVPVALGSEKFTEIVTALQQQAMMSRQQKQEQTEWHMHHHHQHLHHNNRSNKAERDYDEDEDDDSDDDSDEDEYDLTHDNLKSIAAQYLSEFVANTDEEHLIAALGASYRNDVETLMEAASDEGGGRPAAPVSTLDSQDIMRRFMSGMASPKKAKSTTNEPDLQEDNSGDDEERKSVHRDQMASFAGIAARYLAEVSRPREIKRTVNTCRHEQAVAVKELKAFLEDPAFELSLENDGANDEDDKSNQSRLESLIAKFIQNNCDTKVDCNVATIVAELQRREGKEFSKALSKYLRGVRQSAILAKRKRAKYGKAVADEKNSSRTSALANRYMASLEKEEPPKDKESGTSNVAGQDAVTGEENITADQRAFEQFAANYLRELFHSDSERNNDESLDECDIFAELREENRKGFFKLVTNYLETVNTTMEFVEPQPDAIEEAQQSVVSPEKPAALPQDPFATSQPILKKLGIPNDTECTNQKAFEAIASRYLASASSRNLASASRCDENAIFAELGRKDRQGFSRIVTRYLDELLQSEMLSDDTSIVSRYLDNVLSNAKPHSASATATRIVTQNAVNSIIRQYITTAFPSIPHEKITTSLQKRDGTLFTDHVVSYLASVSDCVGDRNRTAPKGPLRNGQHQQGAVHKYLQSLTDKATNEDNTDVSTNKSESLATQSVTSSTVEKYMDFRRSAASRSSVPAPQPSGGRNPEGIAARYLSTVADEYDDDDIFAELRKQESPKFLDVSCLSTENVVDGSEDRDKFMVSASPATNDGPPSLHNSVLNYLAKLRTDCDDVHMLATIGSLGERNQDQAHFADGVTRLLLGVSNSTVIAKLATGNAQRSRASASRYLASMRGIADEAEEEATVETDFESGKVEQAAKLLAVASNHRQQSKLSLSMKKLGKQDCESFAELIIEYLDGYQVTTAGPRRDSEGVPLHVESNGYFSERNNPMVASPGDPFVEAAAAHNIPDQQPHVNNDAKLPGETESPKVLKNTSDSYSNRRDSFSRDVIEEKKTSERSNSFEDHNMLPTEGDAENIPFETNNPVDYPDDASHEAQGFGSPNRSAFSRSSPGRSYASQSAFSPERLRDFHQTVMETGQGIIDTDGTTSEASDAAFSPNRVAGLMLSPAILTKRHRQAVQAIVNRKWEQVAYLLSANPWLAEMPEIRTSQYLLHKVAEYGSGDALNPPAPKELCNDLVKMYPAAQKFDREGNLPLHMASASGNLKMIAILGESFRGGASVRNEDGMLPLHLACANQRSNEEPVLEVVQSILSYFPGALAVADNEGSLPLHIAAQHLSGDEGVDVINLLLDEADKQLKDPFGIRFRNKVKVEEMDDASLTSATVATTDFPDEADDADDELPPSLVVNDVGDTPLTVAIRRSAGSEIIEALAIGPGGRRAVLKQDMNQNNALHMLLAKEQVSAHAIKSILKVAPEAVFEHNMERLLPIEVSICAA